MIMDKIEMEGIVRVATRYLINNPPADRHQAYSLLAGRYGAYDRDGDYLISSVEAYFDH